MTENNETGDEREEIDLSEPQSRAGTGSAKRTSLRTKFLLAVLVALALGWVVAQVQVRAMENDLTNLTGGLSNEYAPDMETTFTITVAKDFVLFGPARGKIELFARPKGFDGYQAISGIEFFYELEAGAWVLKESASCHNNVCQTRGQVAFAALDERGATWTDLADL